MAAALLAVVVLLCPCASDRVAAEPAKAAQKTRLSACDRGQFRTVLDVGHTAEVPGAISARGVYEYDFNLHLATKIRQRLIDGGFAKTVLMVTHGKAMKSLSERVARANQSGADLFLSIHHDSVPDKFLEKWEYDGAKHIFSDKFKGHSIFVSHYNHDFGGSLAFGRLLGKELKTRGLQYTPHYTQKFMGHRQRLLVDADAGVYRYDQLIVLKDTRMAAVLLEAGSIINRDEELAMESPDRQFLISAAVADAVDEFCAARRPQKPEQIAREPGVPAPSKRTYAPAAMLPSVRTR
jgi:N-acetylmuramoyl-L-alanine amidase